MGRDGKLIPKVDARFRIGWADGQPLASEEVVTLEGFSRIAANLRSLYRLMQDGAITSATVTIELEARADAHG